MSRLGPYEVPGRYFGDCRTLLREVPDGCVQTCVTSPPYWGLRDYGVDGQLGLEATPEEYVANMVEVFHEVWRVLRDDGTLWLNLGDSYAHSGCGARDVERWPKQERNDHMPKHRKRGKRADTTGAVGLKPKDLVGIPWRVAFALQADGWYLRSDIVWHKTAPMPESVQDRPTRAHEFVFLLSKSERYSYDAHAIREVSVSVSDAGNGYAPAARLSVDGGHAGQAAPWTRESSGGTRNARDVWTLGPEPFADAHFAVMPAALAKRCVLAGTSAHGACAECGSMWERVVESRRRLDGAAEVPAAARNTSKAKPSSAQGVGHHRITVDKTERGWRPTCECGRSDVRPCVVLDPFFGSGTVGRVAEDLGREWLGFDLNPAYDEIQARRLAQQGLDLGGAA